LDHSLLNDVLKLNWALCGTSAPVIDISIERDVRLGICHHSQKYLVNI